MKMRRTVVEIDSHLPQRRNLVNKCLFVKVVIPELADIPVFFGIGKNKVLLVFVIARAVRKRSVILLVTPIPSPSPGTDGSVVRCLQHGVMDFIELDDVAATPPIVESHGGLRHVIDQVMTDGAPQSY